MMPEAVWRLLWPDSLLGRMGIVITAGTLCAQMAGSALWLRQQLASERAQTLHVAQQLGSMAASTILHFSALRPGERATAVERLSRMGGTRYQLQLRTTPAALPERQTDALSESIIELVCDDLMNQLESTQVPQVAFTRSAPRSHASMDTPLAAQAQAGSAWMESTLLPHTRPVLQLVIQYQLGPAQWLSLRSPLFNPYIMAPISPFSPERMVWHLLTLVIVLVPTLLVVRSQIRPLGRIADAAMAFDSASIPDPIAESGSAELRRTAHAFNSMLGRIRAYLIDRERLFIAISHSLKTPIMRLKLRTELLHDAQWRSDFHEDLDDLDVLVKSALQSLRETDIHENLVAVRLDQLLARLARRPIDPEASVTLTALPLQVQGKPLALERAFGNLIDNGVLYGQRVQVRLTRLGSMAVTEIRDFGPGIPCVSMAGAFEPHVRLCHGKRSNRAGTGLGLGIARNIVQAHQGEISLHNHVNGGLVVTVRLPALTHSDDRAAERAR